MFRRRDSSVGTAERVVFDFQQCNSFLFPTESRSILGPIQPPIRWVRRAISPEVKRQGREADHSPLSSVEIKKGGAIPPLPHICSWHSI
jgi:hypothetical protein